MGLCARPINLGALYEYLSDYPQHCQSILNETRLFTVEALHQACPAAFVFFIQSMMLINQGTCPNSSLKIKLKLHWFHMGNGTDILGEQLNNGTIDVIPHPHFYMERPVWAQHVGWTQPIAFSRFVLLVGSRALILPHRPLTLLLTPFTPLVWLFSMLAAAAATFIDIFHMKVHQTRQFLYLRQLMVVFYCIYSLNLKAIISQPRGNRLPFKDLPHLASNLNLGKQQLIFSEAFSNWVMLAKLIIPGLDHDYKAQSNYTLEEMYQVVASSDSIFTLADEGSALLFMNRIAQETLASVELVPLVSVPQPGGFLVSKRRARLGELLSRVSEIVQTQNQLPIDRIANKRANYAANGNKARGDIHMGHLKLVFLVGAVGCAIALAAFLLENVLAWFHRGSMDLVASERHAVNGRSMEDGVFRKKTTASAL